MLKAYISSMHSKCRTLMEIMRNPQSLYLWCAHLKPVNILMDFLWICVSNSQSLSTLSVIEEFLSKRPMPQGIVPSDNPNQNWVRNLNYYSEFSSLCFFFSDLSLSLEGRVYNKAILFLLFSVLALPDFSQLCAMFSLREKISWY